MTDDIIRLPGDLISVTPQPDCLTFTYREVDGQDLVGILIDDARVGHIEMMLTPSAARYAAANLNAMLASLDDLRAQWRNK